MKLFSRYRRLQELLILLYTVLTSSACLGQVTVNNNKVLEGWPAGTEVVNIPSSADSSGQAAMFYRASGRIPRPLVVSLHTWSRGYDQQDTLAWLCAKNNFNYIHPDFRGPNNRSEACGSRLVISDLEDAIRFATTNGNTDTAAIHVIGLSGGGHAALLLYMQSSLPVKTFSAWVPVSDLLSWYEASRARQAPYALDIAQATTGLVFQGEELFIDSTEARARSPFYQDKAPDQRKNCKLNIYCGIHDGYTGSVPISQSLLFYNKLVRDSDPGNSNDLVKEGDIIRMLADRTFPHPDSALIDGRIIHFRKLFDNRIQLVVFEGTHELLPGAALEPLKGKNTLLIGDSNGAFDYGWAMQLAKIRSTDFFCNTSKSGNTIGFYNNGRKDLSTLEMLDSYINRGMNEMRGIDRVIIMLGTNDCKAVFADSSHQVIKNMDKLIMSIRKHPLLKEKQPEIILVSPPPAGADSIMLEKYHGAAERLSVLLPGLGKLAHKRGCTFIDTWPLLEEPWSSLSEDGIHLSEEGQKILAAEINRFMDRTSHH